MVRDLQADLEICNSATPGPYEVLLEEGCIDVVSPQSKSVAMVCNKEVATFFANARIGWPETIKYAMKLEDEIDRLRNEINILQEMR